jgi:ADP-ribose pyrophosphatase
VPFRHVNRQSLVTGAFLSFDRFEIESPDGQRAERFMLTHPGAVALLPVDGDDVLLVRQYRGPVDMEMLEVPAGKLDAGETDSVGAVRRECVEEVGMDPGIIEPLGHMFTSPGITNERIDLFWVGDLKPVPVRPDGLEEEHSEIIRVPIDSLGELVASGTLTDGKSIATISRYLLRNGA